jgi:hypothetical protein
LLLSLGDEEIQYFIDSKLSFLRLKVDADAMVLHGKLVEIPQSIVF